jgi:regulator of replication initiation timing
VKNYRELCEKMEALVAKARSGLYMPDDVQQCLDYHYAFREEVRELCAAVRELEGRLEEAVQQVAILDFENMGLAHELAAARAENEKLKVANDKLISSGMVDAIKITGLQTKECPCQNQKPQVKI